MDTKIKLEDDDEFILLYECIDRKFSNDLTSFHHFEIYTIGDLFIEDLLKRYIKSKRNPDFSRRMLAIVDVMKYLYLDKTLDKENLFHKKYEIFDVYGYYDNKKLIECIRDLRELGIENKFGLVLLNDSDFRKIYQMNNNFTLYDVIKYLYYYDKSNELLRVYLNYIYKRKIRDDILFVNEKDKLLELKSELKVLVKYKNELEKRIKQIANQIEFIQEPKIKK